MSADLQTNVGHYGVGSSGMPVGESRPTGRSVVQLQTTETTLLSNTGAGARTVNIGLCNLSGGAASVTMYLKEVPAGVVDTGAAKNTIMYQFALPTTGEPEAFQALQNLVVEGDQVLTALLSTGANNAVNAFVTGMVQK